MGKFGKVCFFTLLLALILSGSHGTKPSYQPMAVVTRVEVTCREGEHWLRRTYTKPEKICRILNYLRLRENLGQPSSDPERICGPSYRICIRTLDGSSHIYQQRADRYLSKEFGPWQTIVTEQPEQLRQILLRNRSDTMG